MYVVVHWRDRTIYRNTNVNYVKGLDFELFYKCISELSILYEYY